MHEYIRQGKMRGRKIRTLEMAGLGKSTRLFKKVKLNNKKNQSETELTETRAIFTLGGHSGREQIRPTSDRARNSRMKTLLKHRED